MASVYGKNVRISIFGQSHSEAIGVTMDGLPAGLSIDMAALGAFLARRAPGKNAYSTQRREADAPEFISGLVNGVTCGAPVTALIRNTDARSRDYENLRHTPRPGHADYTAFVKYGSAHDLRGGGHFSGRLTAPLCIAGGICLQLLQNMGVEIAAHITGIGHARDRRFTEDDLTAEAFHALRTADFPVLTQEAGDAMRAAIDDARSVGDSLGGVIECAAMGLPPGLGDPMFDGMENRIAAAIFAIPAVKGIEFGAGFEAAEMRGSAHNDAFYGSGGKVRTRTNHHGGILGGITSGMPLIFRAAIKPTPSIAMEQESVLLPAGENARLTVGGRHDPCIVPRAVPCMEATAALAIYDAYLDYKKYL